MSLVAEKITQASGILREVGVDCWLTFVRETGMNGDPVMPFLAPGHVTWQSAFLVTAREARAIVGQYDKKTVEDTGAYATVEGYVQSVKEPLLAALRELDPRHIAINYSEDSEVCDGLTHGMFLKLHGYLREIGFENRLAPAEKVISALRARKTPTELGRIKEAIRLTEQIFDEVGGFLADRARAARRAGPASTPKAGAASSRTEGGAGGEGASEREVAEFVNGKLEARGLDRAWEASTCPAVFSGPDTAGAHYAPTARRVEPGHVVNMDFGVRHDDYCADLQRTWYVLRPGESRAPAEVQRGFETIVRAIEESRQAMRPGVTGQAIDAVARGIVTGAGYDEFPHALGHQVGRFAHDGTALLGPAWEKYATRPFVPIEKGMVFTLEPRLTIRGFGVATVEEMVVVTDEGAEFLSRAQTQLRLV